MKTLIPHKGITVVQDLVLTHSYFNDKRLHLLLEDAVEERNPDGLSFFPFILMHGGIASLYWDFVARYLRAEHVFAAIDEIDGEKIYAWEADAMNKNQLFRMTDTFKLREIDLEKMPETLMNVKAQLLEDEAWDLHNEDWEHVSGHYGTDGELVRHWLRNENGHPLDPMPKSAILYN